MNHWLRTCLFNWRWWVALPIALAVLPAALVSLIAPITTPPWYRRMNKWVFANTQLENDDGA